MDEFSAQWEFDGNGIITLTRFAFQTAHKAFNYYGPTEYRGQ